MICQIGTVSDVELPWAFADIMILTTLFSGLLLFILTYFFVVRKFLMLRMQDEWCGFYRQHVTVVSCFQPSA